MLIFESREQRVNWLREKMVEIATYLQKSQGQVGGRRYTENLSAAITMEDILVEFERLVDSMPEEARSSRPLKTEWLGFEKTFP